ncbi:MAG: UPF0182 family protein [Gemmatimonadaceae bacterium]
MTQRRGRWRWVAGILVALAVGRGMAGLVAGAAQAEALGVRPSWRLFAAMDLSLRTMVAAVAALVCFANLWAVRHSIVSVVLPRQIGNLRIGEAIPMRWLTLGAAAVALAIGALFASVDLDGQQILLALHGVRFGEVDPFLERDIAWYLIGLPVERALWETVVAIVTVASLLTVALYAGTPSLRLRDGRLVVTGWVRRHLGVLGGVALLLVAWHWRLARYELLVEGSGAAEGFGAVDHRLLLPYLLTCSIVAVGAAGVFIATVWQGAHRVALVLALSLLVIGPAGRLALVSFAPSLGATTRGIRDREAAYTATRMRFTQRAHGEHPSGGDRPPSALDSLQGLLPAGAVIRPDGGRYRVVRDTTGQIAAAPLASWGERLSQAWALQNPRLAMAGGEADDGLVWGANPWSRVAWVAPFVRPGPAPRLVVHQGSTLWVLDLAIEGEWYPLADSLPDRGGVVRYHRSAGLALVDAMTGAVRLVPPAAPDPILRAWMALVPDVFATGALVGVGLTLDEVRAAPQDAHRMTGPRDGRSPATSPDLAGPRGDLRAEAAALYEAMEAARQVGDWAAYGAAWRQLGILLGRSAP